MIDRHKHDSQTSNIYNGNWYTEYSMSRSKLIGLSCRQLFTLALLVILLGAPNTWADSVLVPQDNHGKVTRVITQLLKKYHYKDFSINDALSEKILNSYIASLDPNRSYFYQNDVNKFEAFRFSLDDALNHQNLDVPFEMFRLYQVRVDERITYALSLLSTEFDFNVQEEFIVDRSESDWPADTNTLNEIWRKRVKNDVLSLKLADQTPDEIRKTLEKRYQSIAKRSQLDAEDVYQVFINSFTRTLEPHTSYLSPRTSENFAIRMSLSLEGIGALLRVDGEYTLVEKIIPGGPADKSGLLHASDRIVGIAQQGENEFKDVVGWRLEEVVDLIRGTKGTAVRLQILPGEEGLAAKIREIQIIRDKIKLEEQAAKSEIINIHNDAQTSKIGVIDVPAFYIDISAYQRGEAGYRSTTRDVDRLISELKLEGIDALVLDLRGNGGGSLTEATQLAGLFLDEGPIVQVQNSSGHVRVHRDHDPKISYRGPLIVLVDRFSASASEIVASMIQDYRYGVIVGETTFGKGTVQQLIDLNSFRLGRKAKFGQLKTTIAQYFRVSGASTQHKGVVPDIDFETIFTDEHGERSLKNALPWSSISAINHHYGAVTQHVLLAVMNMHKSRILNNKKYKSLMNMLQHDSELRHKKSISLLESTRKKEYEKNEAARLANQDLLKNLQESSSRLDNEEFVDVLLIEAAHIAADLAILLKSHQSRAFGSRITQPSG